MRFNLSQSNMPYEEADAGYVGMRQRLVSMETDNAFAAQGATTVDAITTDPGRDHRLASRSEGWCLTILAHPTPSRIGAQFHWDSSPGLEVQLSRLTPLFRSVFPPSELPLEDSRISRSPIRILTTLRGLELTADNTRVRFELDGRPVTGREFLSTSALGRGVVLTLGRHVALLLNAAPHPGQSVPIPGLLGVSGSIRRVWEEIARVAPLDLPVLLTGESGVGKELAAHAIHRLSTRANRNFVAVNIAAMTSSTAAAELFGHSRGAFTGAEARRVGYFGEAEGGTLFLDEIGETPFDVQPMLLRAIESGEIQPLGLPPRTSNVRILSATDAQLEKLMSAGRFRPALLHRLRATHVALPPLRDRREDIPVLLVHFLQEALSRFSAQAHLEPTREGVSPWLSTELVMALIRYSWPGNVRELRNVAYEIALNCHALQTAVPPQWLAERLQEAELSPIARRPTDPGDSSMSTPRAVSTDTVAQGLRPAEISEELLRSTLEAKDWGIGATALALGISRNSLYTLMKDFGIVHAAGLTSAEILAAAEAEKSRDPGRLAARLRVSERGLVLRMRTLGLQL